VPDGRLQWMGAATEGVHAGSHVRVEAPLGQTRSGTAAVSSPPNVLVLAPKLFESYYGGGNWKDVRSINLLLSALSSRPRLHTFDPRHPEAISEALTSATTDVVVYSSWWPELLRRLRHDAPSIRLHVRTANAEAFQHWHRSKVKIENAWESARVIYGVIRLAARDSSCRRLADTLLGISEWDNRHYWDRLPGRATVFDVPYVSPWPELRPHVQPLPWPTRRPVVLSMPGASDAIGLAAQQNFKWLAESFAAEGLGGRWEFALSPGWEEGERPKPAPPTRFYPGPFEPWDALCAVRAVAVLTPFGFGAKTTIFDALAAGCHVLLDARLWPRIPEAIRSRCIPLQCGKAIDAASVERRLNEPPASEDLHSAIRLQALSGLKRALG
jgi:hypothetical protein